MQGRLQLTTLLLLVHICIAHSFSIVYNNGKEGRKLFGGYRISPKTCTVGVRKGICMFNYECTLHKGAMLGSCMDGFLFGTCCNLPANANVVDNNMFVPPSSQQQQHYDYDLNDEDHDSFNTNLYQSSTFDDTFSKPPSLRPPNSNHAPPTPKPAVTEKHPLLQVDAHPETDTILLHQNGSAVEDFSNPEDYYKPLRDTITPDPDADADFSTFSHVAGSNVAGSNVAGSDIITTLEVISAESMASVATKAESSTESASTESMDTSSTSSEASSAELKSTTMAERVSSASYPATNKLETRPLELVTTQWPWTKAPSTQAHTKPTTEDFTPTYYSSRWPTNHPRPTIGFRPRPTPPSVIKDPVAEMVLVPTLLNGNHQGASSLAPNSESINQVLSMLDVNSPVEIATPAMEVEQKLTSKKPGIVTWASLHSQSTTMNRRPTPPSVFYSTPAKRPTSQSATTLSVAGPSFEVVNTRPGPPPTVIVLGPLTSDFTTTRPTTNRKPVIFSSTNKVKVTAKPGAFKPSSSGKPGIIITKRTTTTPAPTTAGKPSSSTSNIGVKRPSTVVPKRPTTTGTRKPITTSESEEEEAVTSIADLSNFPPVRNPSLNTSRPVGEITEIVTPPPIVHVAVTEEEPLEANTPIFIEDDKLDDKMDLFVNKIVESLQGNFQDLEDVLYKRKNASDLAGPTSKRPIAQDDDVVTKPTPTKRPTRTTTPKTKPVASTTAKPTRPRPSKKPSTTKPFRVSTEEPFTTTKKPRRTTTTTPAPTTTPTPPTTTTRRPRPTVTTKKPKRTTTPEYEDDEIIETTTKVPRKTTTESEEIVDEEDEDVTTLRPADYRRDCGVRPLMKKKGRIVGGKGSTFGEWPWQVLVRESTWLGLFTKNKCGGVLITNKFVMTAAHCQPGFLANLVAVFGEYDISGELESKRSVTKNVRRVIVHRHYDAATFANDLALLELDSAVAFDTHIVPICMPSDDEDFTGRMATVSGWGRLKYGGGVPSVLQEVHVPIIENSVCQEMFQTAGHSKTILDSFLCAGYANGQKDSCEGDSGGPLMLERDDGRWTLAGTVSHGIKCAAPYLPGVYMRTTYYKPWLKTITGVDG